nr:hypothetical protein [Methylomarinum sp. Ch1-1]MDP4520046.1 hypothetical protein [Methylomarinum sp. Ch1-1]
MTLQKHVKNLAAILSLFVCQGCAEIKTLGGNDEIAEYAEAVFSPSKCNHRPDYDVDE